MSGLIWIQTVRQSDGIPERIFEKDDFKATHSCLELPTIIHLSDNPVYSLFTSVVC